MMACSFLAPILAAERDCAAHPLRAVPEKMKLKPSFLAHLRSLPPVPKKIHMIWPDKRVVNDSAAMVKHGLGNLIRLNPDWKTTVYEYADRPVHRVDAAADGGR